MTMIGITEGYDPAFCDDWKSWVFEKRNPAILITKNFIKLCDDNFGILQQNCIFHVTCTGLAGTIFEPNCPSVDSILSKLNTLSKHTLSKIVLRIDPICTPLFDFNNEYFDGKLYFENIKKLMQFGVDHQLRMRISFMDFYPHMVDRLKIYPELLEHLQNYYHGNFHLPLEKRLADLGYLCIEGHCKFEICGEPGMACAGCISQKDLQILNIDCKDTATGFQRPACACLGLKKELTPKKERCPHQCLYCFWR